MVPSPHRITPGDRFVIGEHPTRAEDAPSDRSLDALRGQITALADRFAAQASHALLIVLQGFDGAGKDEVITHVLGAIDPSMLHVFSFNTPVGDEQHHDFLWRFHHQTPPLGAVHVFDRSYYEEVISARVHDLVDADTASDRCASINDFERILTRDRTIVLKVFLHVSPDVQAERVEERLERRDKHHEFSAADVTDREKWDEYDRAYGDAITATSTDDAPWFAIGADDRDAARLAVAQLLVDTLEALDPQYPELDPEELEEAGLGAR